jgi:hypothetical protein
MDRTALASGRGSLVKRLLELPNLVRVVQSLEPRALHAVIRACGLEACGEIVALATTDQLARIFDEDLWSERVGCEERFDAERFGLWLEVLAEADEAAAAQKLAEMDPDFVTAALSRHLLVVDLEAIALSQMSLQAEAKEADPRELLAESLLDARYSYEFSGLTIVARDGAPWDALLAVLLRLEADHHDCFARLMARCCEISSEYIADNGGLYDVLTSAEQVMSDAASDRERRREATGYLGAAQAVAFLKLARQLRVAALAAPPAADHLTATYFRAAERHARRDGGLGEGRKPDRARDAGGADEIEPRVIELLAALRDSGALPSARPALVSGTTVDGESRTARIREHLLHVERQDAAAHSRRMSELGYLANVLMAGCSFRSRRFREVEAADAVLAVCNLGIENWPARWRDAETRGRRRPGAAREAGEPPDLLIHHDLVSVFRVGWSLVHERVSMLVAGRLVKVLGELACDDRWVQEQLTALRAVVLRHATAGTPWKAREDIEVLAILDPPSWLVLAGLLDECPVVPRNAGRRAAGPAPERISADGEFISENSQIAWVAEFMDGLAERLVS